MFVDEHGALADFHLLESTECIVQGMNPNDISWQTKVLDKFDRFIETDGHKFRENQPFPHIYVDDLFPEEVIDYVLNEFPTANDPIWEITEVEDIQIKLRTDWKSESDMAPSARNLIHFLNSGAFLQRVTKLTGIDCLISDPYLTGGGLNCILPGGVLDVHADGNWHHAMAVHRRLNAILYLNRNWKPEYGGDFELWDRDLKGCVAKIAPLANRLMIFETHDYTYHGHPNPLTCPPDNSRKSAIVYYYTSEPRPEDQVLKEEPHRALWRRKALDSL